MYYSLLNDCQLTTIILVMFYNHHGYVRVLRLPWVNVITLKQGHDIVCVTVRFPT